MTVHEYPPFLNGIGAWFVKRVTKIPTCAEVHHLVGEPVPADWKESVLRQFNRFLPFVTRYSDRIRVVNSSVKTHLMERGIPAEKIVVVPSLYLNLQALYPAEEVGPYDLIFVGRLVPNKGLITVIKALASLPEAVLLVVGEGPERERAEVLAKKLGLTGRITFAGWLPGIDDIAAALRSAKIFVMNSTSEGGPRVLLEAMACGLPVVTTPVGIAPDVIREGVNGHFHDGSVMTLVSVLQALLADPITARLLGKSGRSDAERFEFSVGIKVYADFLQSLSR
jgi:glycosyltransferase involved in cell wall biosynthesis